MRSKAEMAEYHRQWREKNKAHVLAYHRRWRAANAAKCLESYRKWLKKNRERANAYSRASKRRRRYPFWSIEPEVSIPWGW